MTLDRLGETGSPKAQRVPPPNEVEISIVRVGLSRENIIDPLIVEDIIWRVYELRGWDQMRLDAEPTVRRLNLNRSLKLARADRKKEAKEALSSKNRYALDLIHQVNSDLPLIDALCNIRDNLPKRGRGRSPNNGRHITAVYIAHLLETHGFRLSTTRGGLFVRVLALVFSVASNERIDEPHHVAERALRNRARFVDGLMEISCNP